MLLTVLPAVASATAGKTISLGLRKTISLGLRRAKLFRRGYGEQPSFAEATAGKMAKEKKTVFIHQPLYKGGPKELTKFIYSHLRYPKEALDAGIEGVVYLEYDIDYLGNVVATRVLQGIGHGCDEEACRVVQLLKFDVERNRGVHVLFHQKVKVQFKKPKKVPAPAPLAAASMQAVYTVTSSSPAPSPEEKPAQVTYHYTIQL